MSARILCVEDNAANMQLMTYLLRSHGHDTIEAVNGPEGLERASEGCDLVLLDLQLPGMTGEAVLGRLRDLPLPEGVPVVAVTAFAMVGDRERVLAMGFDGYIAKPIDPEGFVEQVEAHLPVGKHGRRPSATLERGAAAVAAPEERPRALVLVVDDHRNNLDLMRSALEPFGYRVVGAGTMSDGLTAARAQRPDLIICDVHMPGGNGFAMLEALRQDPLLRDVPFGLTTWTATGATWERRAREAGAAFFLRRPIEPGELVARLEGLLTSRR